jgi:carboxyl-terminal processing protease
MRTPRRAAPAVLLALLALASRATASPQETKPDADDRKEFLDGRYYVDRLATLLRDHHPTLEEVSQEQFAARSLVALRQRVHDDPRRLDRTGLAPSDLDGACEWDALVKRWLPEGVADTDPQVDARTALLADAMLDALDDRFTRLIRGDHVMNLSLLLELSIPSEMGVGVRRHGGDYLFDAVVRDSDAWWKGVRPGDRLLAVDGVDVAPLRPADAERLLAKPARLTVTRDGFAEPVELTVDSFAASHGALGALVAPDVGWLAFQLFEQGGYVSLVHAVTQLRERGAKALVLDLRGNPGGVVLECQSIASLFLADGSVVANLQERGDPKLLPEQLIAKRPRFSDVPLVVLTDGGSASASEMLVAALQDAGRARLVGERTFGKGIGQAVQAVPFGGEHSRTGLPRADVLILTTLRFSSPKGRDHHGIGVLPDVPVRAWPAETRERFVARVRRLGSTALAEALLDAELTDADVAALRQPGPPPPSLERLAASLGFPSATSEEGEALKDVARIAQRGTRPELAACPAFDPALVTAIGEARRLVEAKPASRSESR